MKIIITENKLEKVITKLLSKDYSEMDIYDHDGQPWVFYVDKYGEIILIYQQSEKDIYFTRDVMDLLCDTFTIDVEILKHVIKNWFTQKYNLKVVKVIPWNFNDASDWKKILKWETKKRLSN